MITLLSTRHVGYLRRFSSLLSWMLCTCEMVFERTYRPDPLCSDFRDSRSPAMSRSETAMQVASTAELL